MAERRPKPTKVSNPESERLLIAVLATAAYLAATERISDTGRPFAPWIREIGIALALAPVVYVAYLLAQLAGAALGRLFLSTVTIGFGGRMRIVETAQRDIVLRRWPVRVGLNWAAAGRAIRARMWLPCALPVVVFAAVALVVASHGYAEGATTDPWRSLGGAAAAALVLAMVPWPCGPDRYPSTAALLWLLPRLSAGRARAAFEPYADERQRGPLLAFRRAAFRHDAEATEQAIAELIASGAPAHVIRSCQGLGFGLRGEYLSGARAVVENLRDAEVSNSWDLSQLFAHVLAGLEAGQDIPDDLVTLTQGHVGNLARACGRDEFAEKYGLLALQDGHLLAAEKWVCYAIAHATTDVVEGDALLTLARIRAVQGRPDAVQQALDRARLIHPKCPRWQSVPRLVADSDAKS